MDRNSIIGLTLIGLILVISNLFFSPETTEIVKSNADTSKVIQAATPPIVDFAKDSLLNQEKFGSFSKLTSGFEKETVLKNKLIEVTFNSKGGVFSQVRLFDYKTYDQAPLYIINKKDSKYSYTLFAENRTIETADLYFAVNVSDSVLDATSTSKSITYTATLENGGTIEHVYTLEPNSFLVKHKLNLYDLNKVLQPNVNYAVLNWNVNTPHLERSVKEQRQNSTAIYKLKDEDVDKISYGKDDEEVLETDVEWIAFKQKFFTTTLLAEKGFEKGKISSKSYPTDSHIKMMGAEMNIPITHKAKNEINFQFYFGPNHYKTLKAVGHDFEKQIPLGWGIFGWVNKYLIINVFHFLDSFSLNYGLIILILTIIIKLILFPFTYKSFISGAKMRLLKPEIDELKEKFGSDPTKLQSENLKLYQKAGVNPLGGCLPMLFQLPILIAMFNFFPSSIELRQQAFLWAKDLSSYDSIWNFGYIPIIDTIYGDHMSLFTILMTISTIIYTRMNNQMMGANNQMAWIGYVMPFMFLGIFNNYSSGLSYYYFLSNITSLIQQYIIRNKVDENELHRIMQENKKKPVSSKKSSFQKRLEEMSAQQQKKTK